MWQLSSKGSSGNMPSPAAIVLGEMTVLVGRKGGKISSPVRLVVWIIFPVEGIAKILIGWQS